MSVALATTVGPSAYWYLTRASGIVALILLTLSVVLGVIDVEQFSTQRGYAGTWVTAKVPHPDRTATAGGRLVSGGSR